MKLIKCPRCGENAIKKTEVNDLGDSKTIIICPFCGYEKKSSHIAGDKMDNWQGIIQNLKLARINSEIAEANLNDVLRELATRIEHLQKALEARNV